jgi:ribosomal protein RSM22 (predicted rRNA methylase)
MIELRVCADGRIETSVVSRRAGQVFRAARDLEWGDRVPPEVASWIDERNRSGPS